VQEYIEQLELLGMKACVFSPGIRFRIFSASWTEMVVKFNLKWKGCKRLLVSGAGSQMVRR